MSILKTSLPPNPAGPTGWFGRMLAGIGVLAVIAAGMAISPAATDAGHDWSRAIESPSRTPAAIADRPSQGWTGTPLTPPASPRVHRVSHPIPSAAPAEPLRVEPVAASDNLRRPSPTRRVIARLLERAKSGVERLSRGVVVTSAAR